MGDGGGGDGSGVGVGGWRKGGFCKSEGTRLSGDSGIEGASYTRYNTIYRERNNSVQFSLLSPSPTSLSWAMHKAHQLQHLQFSEAQQGL